MDPYQPLLPLWMALTIGALAFIFGGLAITAAVGLGHGQLGKREWLTRIIPGAFALGFVAFAVSCLPSAHF